MSREDFRKGVAYGIAAYGMWGLIPIYFKAVSAVPALEVLAHRVVWSVVILAPLVVMRGQWTQAWRALRQPKTLATLLLTTALIAVNWYLFIWAVAHDRVIEASLGYFINPLVNIVLGMVFLGERMSRWTAVAVLLAGIGVGAQVVMIGRVPLIALALAFSFGLYGLLRKTARVGSVVGLTVETSLLLPIALGYLVWARRTGRTLPGLRRAFDGCPARCSPGRSPRCPCCVSPAPHDCFRCRPWAFSNISRPAASSCSRSLPTVRS